MKKLLLILFALVSQYSITVVHAQSLTTANTGIKIPTDDIHSIISNHSTEEDLNNLKTDLQAKGVKLTILSIARKSDGSIKNISIQVSSADGAVSFNSDKFSEIVIERNDKVKIGVHGGVTNK
ncbi:hypothetical protein LBMAG27_04050 [Bacteroidota bacterium]|nr:hypothetical protein LBMAG27_04050 [Bacteroidota bacterium]